MDERLFKYHGLGNDFLVADRRSTGVDLEPAAVRALCDRRLGIGADGVLALLPSAVGAARMVVHNSDGSIAEMCGNGIRCAVKHVIDRGSAKPNRVVIETGRGPLECAVSYRDGEVSEVEVSMGPARLVDRHLPSGVDGKPWVLKGIPGFSGVIGTAISLGNPHLVLFDRPSSEAPALGPRLECAPLFPERTNVAFASGEQTELSAVIWERGAGLTPACGTGACAVVAASVVLHRSPPDRWIDVALPGGTLHVFCAADLSAVKLKGPATFVFEAVA